MRSVIHEWIVREETISDVAVVPGDDVAQLERQRGGDGDGTRHIPIVMEDLRRSLRASHAADHILAIKAPNAFDGRVECICLTAQAMLRQIAQIELDVHFINILPVAAAPWWVASFPRRRESRRRAPWGLDARLRGHDVLLVMTLVPDLRNGHLVYCNTFAN